MFQNLQAISKHDFMQVVLSHTPYRQLVKHLGNRPVLISGRGNFHHVAREYGFTQSVTTEQLARSIPDALPLSQHGPQGASRSTCSRDSMRPLFVHNHMQK